jgi:hypothetical protein
MCHSGKSFFIILSIFLLLGTRSHAAQSSFWTFKPKHVFAGFLVLPGAGCMLYSLNTIRLWYNTRSDFLARVSEKINLPTSIKKTKSKDGKKSLQVEFSIDSASFNSAEITLLKRVQQCKYNTKDKEVLAQQRIVELLKTEKFDDIWVFGLCGSVMIGAGIFIAA